MNELEEKKKNLLAAIQNAQTYELAHPEYVSNVVIMGPLVSISTTEGDTLRVSANTVAALEDCRLSKQEVFELLGYLKLRYETYLSTFDHQIKTRAEKENPSTDQVGIFSAEDKANSDDTAWEVVYLDEEYAVPMLSGLLENFSYDQVIAALDDVTDYQLFGVLDKDRYADYSVILEEKIRYIETLVMVHNSYSNGDIYEVTEKYQKGRL